jgi:hypothetical protein
MKRTSSRALRLAAVLLAVPGLALAQAHGGGGAAAGGHAGAAGGGAVAAHAGPAFAGAVHAGAAPVGRAAGAGVSANRYAYARNSAGQLVLRRSSSMSSTRNRGVAGVHSGMSATHRRSVTSDDSTVPGLGFDYSHVAATRPGGAHRRRDRDRGFNDGAILFPYGSGYFVSTGTDVVGDGGDVPVAEEEQPEDQGVPDDRPARTRSVDRMPAAADYEPPAPQPDVPEYVFVRRDGTVFFAVAYSWEQGALKYVSAQGQRRTVARDTLDINATQQFNEQRGMNFRAPTA